VPGKRNVDGYQAIWEHVNQRPMVYPKPRYSRPFMMDPAHYEWTPVEGAPGVAEKFLGVFTERRTTAGFLQLDPGTVYKAAGRAVYVVLEGRGTIADQTAQTLTTIFVERGEEAVFTARETIRMLRLGLPDLSGITGERASETAIAAE
jgi:hypothetical protein